MDYEKEKGTIDYLLLFGVVILTFFGLYIVFSATYYRDIFGTSSNPFATFKREVLFVILGFFAMFFFTFIPMKFVRKISFIIMWVSIILLIVTYFVGEVRNGSVRWFSLGIFNLRVAPADFAKLASVIFFAKLFENLNRNRTIYKRTWIYTIFYAGLTALLILFQPDFSTTIIYVAIVGMMFLVSGAKLRHVVVVGLCALILVIGILYVTNKQYVLRRLYDYFKEEESTEFSISGSEAQTQQAYLSIAEGEMFGVGAGKAYQNKYAMSYPESDFAFATTVEITGFTGAVLLISVYLFIIYRILRVALVSDDRYTAIFCSGIASMILFHALVHMAVNTDLFPVTGINLPFISSGGTFKLIMLSGIGFVLNLSRQKEVL